MKELILGGARSGKSRLAETRASESGLEVVYIATGQAFDDEFQSRITAHQQRRPSHWLTVEEPLNLAETLSEVATENRCVLVDCLTLWVTNLLCQPQPDPDPVFDRLLELVPDLPGQLIMVSNEVGMGIVPAGQLSRDFVDHSGLLHQRLAAVCDRVTLTVAGLPMILKGN